MYKGKSWIKILGFMASAGILAAIVSFLLPKFWPENKPPIAKIAINKTKGAAPLKITANGLQSSDPEGRPLSFQWTINDKAVSIKDSFEQVIDTPGLKTIVLTVTDPGGLRSTSSTIVEVSTPVTVLMVDAYHEKDDNSSNSLHYIATRDRETNLLKIEPVDRYLTAVYEGEKLKPLNFTYSPWEKVFKFPILDIKLVNNGSETIFLNEAVFHVDKSWLDRRPVPIIDGTGYRKRLPLRNIGWGNMHDTVIEFALTDLENPGDKVARFPYTLTAGDIENKLEANDLTAFFRQEGVDFTLLYKLWNNRHGFYAPDGDWVFFGEDSDLGEPVEGVDIPGGKGRQMPSREYEALLKKALGPFSSGGSLVVGKIEYGSIEKSGELLRKVNDFDAKVYIGLPGEGIPQPPSYKYNVKLKVTGADYVVSVPVSHVIEPGKADRFLLHIAADKSSFHEFKVALKYNNSETILTETISLDLFLSKADANLMKRSADGDVLNPTTPSGGSAR